MLLILLSGSLVCYYFFVFAKTTFAPLCENMASSTKLELHNVLHCRQKRTEPRPQVKCTENFVKFGHVVF